jgi:hypothetical protein
MHKYRAVGDGNTEQGQLELYIKIGELEMNTQG